MQADYGPEGVTLLAAALATAIPAGLIVVLGILLLPITDGARGAYVLLAGGAAAQLLTFVRLYQGSRAARKFRGDRDTAR